MQKTFNPEVGRVDLHSCEHALFRLAVTVFTRFTRFVVGSTILQNFSDHHFDDMVSFETPNRQRIAVHVVYSSNIFMLGVSKHDPMYSLSR